jgi:hypothetical protein
LKATRGLRRQIRAARTPSTDNASLVNLCFQEKLLRLIRTGPVPQTDTGGRGENLKTREITLVKELGNLTP